MTKHIHSGNQFKIILKNSSLYFISSLVTKASYLILLPIMTRLLSPAEYGLIANLQSIIGFSAVFVSLYIDSAFNRFYFENNRSKDQLKKYISSFFWFVALWGFFVTIIFVIVGKVYLTKAYSVDFFPLIILTMISPLLMQLSMFGQFHLRNKLKTQLIVVPSFLIFLLSVGISLFLMIKVNLGVEGRFYGIFSSTLFSFLYYTIVLIKHDLLILFLDKKLLWKGLIFSLPLVPLAMSSWVTTLSDRIIITIYQDVAETGLYDVAYKISQGVRILTESIFQVYAPVMLSMYTYDKSKFNKDVGTFASYFIWVMFFAAFYISILSKELLVFLTAPEYHSAYTLVPIIAFAYCISAQTKYLGSVFSLRQVTYMSTIGYFLQAIINLIFNLILIPIMGKEAAAWSTFVSLIFLTVWCGFWFLKWENVQFEWTKIIKILSIGLLAYVPYFLIVRFLSFGNLAMFTLKIISTAPIIIILSFAFDIIRIEKLKSIFSSVSKEPSKT